MGKSIILISAVQQFSRCHMKDSNAVISVKESYNSGNVTFANCDTK